MRFESVKLGDALLVRYSSGYGKSSNAYYKGTVTYVTKARFTVSFSDMQQVFTKDGIEYPRQTGYSRSYTTLSLWDSKAETFVRKHRLAVKARNLAHKLEEIFSNANYRERIVDQELDENDIENNIALLEKVYETFKKYLPENKI